MACEGNYDTNAFQAWARVPHGSTLSVWIETTGTGLVGTAHLHVDTSGKPSEQRDWSDAELRPGPKRLQLGYPRRYCVWVRVGFTAAAEEEAVIAAEIIKPDGSRHGRPYRYCVHGTNGDEGRSTITAALKKP